MRNNPLLKAIVLSALLPAWCTAAADDTPAPPDTPPVPLTVQDIERIQGETLLLEARLAREKVRSELRSLSPAGDTLRADGVPATPVSGTTSGTGAPETPASALPVLTEVYGVTGRLTARFRLPDGRTVDIRPGQALPGTAWTVGNIAPGSVVLENGTTRSTLHL